MGLGFLNIMFVLGPFLALFGILIGLFAASVAITIAGLALVTISIAASPLIVLNPVGTAFIGIALACLGILFFIGNTFLVRIFYKLTVLYLKFNIKIIKPEGKK